ncbi:MAG: hypothetical protein ACI9TV_001846 [Sulfurimonas sp.]|jgi:hypothetical protein|uniref:transglutaminase family protein n=1 Tax=Sulfurimonas sp. TaxID=2022749 RepID=UPI0039E43CFB
MKFSKQLLHTKAPSPSIRLDIAIVLSIIPHIFVMKFFMILYICIALIFVLKKNKSNKARYFLMLIGAILIALSFFNDYNFSNFSKIQFFVSLVSSVLIYAVSLQKFTGEVNMYLKVSPGLLMLLSFFFFESITMLLYAVFTLFIFTLLNIWGRMNTPLIDVLKLTSKLFISSLPIVIILFLVFPRIAFKKADFGFKADSYVESGYNEGMSVSSDKVKLSNKVVMEVYFEDKNISTDNLYFRGSTLPKQNGLDWESLPYNAQNDRLIKTTDLIQYDITLYPHAKKWIYALDIPTREIEKTELKGDYTLVSKKPIYNKTRYKLNAALSYKLVSQNVSTALEVDLKKNEQTYKALKELIDSTLNDTQKAKQLMNFFKEQNLFYSLDPKNINLRNFTDSFLFNAKNGYCVHFASAFAISARIIGIPSRVVTGFKPSKENMLDNYIVVKSSDAHAWVELYIDDRGWVRFDPTITASQELDELKEIQNKIALENTIFQKINLNFMYVKYIMNNWILNYNRTKQLSILNNLLNDTLYLLKFILWMSGVFILLFLIYISIKTSTCKDEIMCEMNKVLKILKKHNLMKKENESMQAFLLRVEEKTDVLTSDLSKAYHSAKYGYNDKKLNVQILKDEVVKFIIAIT